MGVFEEQARFLTTKYGTAAGPVGLPHGSLSAGGDLATVMVVLGLVLFASIIFVLFRDYDTMQTAARARRETFIP